MSFFPQRKASHVFFGLQRETLIRRGGSWLIREKTVIIQNDYIQRCSISIVFDQGAEWVWNSIT